MPYPNTAKRIFTVIDMSGGVDACWPFKNKPNQNGRPYFSVDGKKYLAYRLVYELIHGEGTLDGLIARHTCDNGGSPICCCNPRHIIPGTQQDNIGDAQERDRISMPKKVVTAIRKLAASGITHQTIADLYGLGRSTVTMMVNGDNYKYEDDEDANDKADTS